MKDIYALFLERFGAFTEIQRKAVERIYSRGNCLVIAPTGSGKTEAAVLPLLKRLMEEKTEHGLKGIKVIYITPLRALNRDLLKRLEWLSSESGISIEVRHGDTPQAERQRQAAAPPDFLITTPESLQNLFLSKRLRSALTGLEAVIVDEVHELFSNKRGTQLAIALERLVEIAGNFQRIGLSATIGDEDEASRWLCPNGNCEVIKSEITKEIEVKIAMPERPTKEIKQHSSELGLSDDALARIERIVEIVKSSNSTLIFTNTRQIAESLGSKLIFLNNLSNFGGIAVHHSSLDKTERIAVENAFKTGAIKSIIATSSLELGIDIGSIDMVIQYGSPKQVTRLVQRIGRGGHREAEKAKGEIIVGNVIDALESLAIAEQAKESKFERQAMQVNAKDVLINQICALSLEYGEIGKEKAYGIIKRSAPYSNLARDEFERLLEFAAEQKLIRLENNAIRQSSKTREYFYSNISVIPEISKYLVKEVTTNRVIASLDEAFVINYLDQGSVFVTKGLPWRVISIENRVVYVEQTKYMEAAVPDWEGEDIPVTIETARRVFAIISRGLEKEEEALLEGGTLRRVKAFITEQQRHFLPGSEVVVESEENYSLIYLPLGKQANELISRLLAYAIYLTTQRQVITRALPYAVIIIYPDELFSINIQKLLKGSTLIALLKTDSYLINSDLFRYKLIQTAVLSGVVSKGATVTRSDAQRILNFYKDTPVYEEAKRDLMANYFDLENTLSFLRALEEGSIKVRAHDGLSPLGKELIKSNYAYSELLSSPTRESDIEEFRRNIIGKKVELFCTYCGYVFQRKLEEKDEKILCERCKSPMLCLFSDDRLVVWQKKKNNKELSEKEQIVYEKMVKEADLVAAYSNRALIALSTYGIGVDTAAKLLKLLRKDYKQFYKDLINAQKNFVRTKQYWSGK